MPPLYTPFQPVLTDSGIERFSFTKTLYPVSKGLRGLVHSYLQISTSALSEYPIIPDGTQAIFVSQNGTLISGGLIQALNLNLPAAGEYFGIRFYPGALRHFFKLDISEIGSDIAEGDFIPAPFIARLHEVIYQYSSFSSRAKICDQWLLQRLNQKPISTLDYALASIYKSCGNINIARDLSAPLGVSSRHLNRLFQRHTGLSTKSFAQTIRFQRASRYLYERPKSSLNVALKTGYFDQSHLLKDFRARLKERPTAFFNRFMSDFYNICPR